MDYFNPFNPYGCLPEVWQQQARKSEMGDLTPEQQEALCVKTTVYGCCSYFAAIAIGIILCALFGSCTTPRIVEQHHHHHYEADTLAVQAAVDSRLSSWHQQMDSSYRQSLALFGMELYHSSHETEVTEETITETTDSLGRTLRQEQRRTERTLSQQQQQLEQRLTSEYEVRMREALDSATALWQQRLDVVAAHWEQTDSTAVSKTPAGDARPWYRRWWQTIEGIIIGAILAAALWLTRSWWRRLFRM